MNASKHARLILLFVLSGALPPAASANAGGTVSLRTEAQKEVVSVDDSGEPKREWVDIERIVPGDTVVYIITAENTGEEPIEDIVIDDPIPTHTRYVDGSAVAVNSSVSFSVDGGESWGAPDTLTVVDEAGNARPATNEDFTHIRFALGYPVAPGEAARVHFKAAVK